MTDRRTTPIRRAGRRVGRWAGRWAGALALTAALLACANPAADEALVAQRALLGLSKAALLSCAGVPDRQASVGNRDFFTYATGRIVSFPAAVGPYPGPWSRGWGWGWPGYAEDVRSYRCEATFTLRDGVVERLVYGGGSSLGECGALVHACMAQVPQSLPPKP